MLFGQHQIDRTIDEHLGEIAALANSPQTLVFLDTNILAYLYKLHVAARHEFFAWLDTVVAAQRLAIPAWAASEYLTRVTSKGLGEFTPKSKEPTQILKALEAMHETASLFVDESLLRRIGIPGDRTTYLNQFRATIDSLSQCTRAFSEQFDPGLIHDELVSHLSSAILDSDLTQLSKRASEDGNARYEHRLPPGFLDGDKEKNKFGDLIIWYELLDKSAADATAFPNVLFVTNDEKKDWVYAPKARTRVIGGMRKSIGNSNPEIKVADPRLIQEFRRHTNHANLTICSLATLIEGLSKVSASQFVQLAAAIQIDTDEELAPSDAATGTSTTELPVEGLPASDEVTDMLTEMPPPATPDDMPMNAPVMPAAPPLHYDMEAIQDGLYQADAPTEINEVIRSLMSHNWYIQNPAIGAIRNFRDQSFTPSAWFVLGRNIYQAACGNSQKAMEFMAGLEAQLAHFPPATAQHILAGMLFEIYFDAEGKLRDTAKFAYADKPLAIVVKPEFGAVGQFIRFHLGNARARTMFMPGDQGIRTVHITTSLVTAEEAGPGKGPIHALDSVVLDQAELMRNIREDEKGMWWPTFGSLPVRLHQLKEKISEDLAIPRWAIATQFKSDMPTDVRFLVPDGRKLDARLAIRAA